MKGNKDRRKGGCVPDVFVSLQLKHRLEAYKRFLKERIQARQGMAFRMKLAKPVAKEFAAYVKEYFPGVDVSNPARDIRVLINAGKNFDAEFTFLYFGQLCPHFIEAYSETYVANLIRQCFSPRDVNERLRRLNANGRAIYEVV